VLLIGAGDELLAVPALGGDPRAITLIGADGQPHTDDGADGQNNEPPIRANEADGQQDSDQLPDVTHSSCLASNRIGSDQRTTAGRHSSGVHQFAELVAFVEQKRRRPQSRPPNAAILRHPSGFRCGHPAPTHCPRGHEILPGRTLVGHQPCSCPGGHTTWTCTN
jgi:hypothetical protein